MNWAGAAQLATGVYTANRRGGNATARYNWLVDTSNWAFDYYFLNIHEGGTNGAAADSFTQSTLAASAQVVMTMPIDRVAKSSARTAATPPAPPCLDLQACATTTSTTSPCSGTARTATSGAFPEEA